MTRSRIKVLLLRRGITLAARMASCL